MFNWFKRFGLGRAEPLEITLGIEKDRVKHATKDSYEPCQGKSTNFDVVDRAEFIEKLHKAALDMRPFYGIATTEVSHNEFVLVLDCDSTDNMLAACNVIKSYYKWNYAAVMSSPEHYWIIVDKVGTVPELIAIMRKIPGVDFKYTDYAEWRKCLVLRAMPKETMPVFPDDSVKFKDRRARNWYSLFKDHWQSEDVAHYLRLRDLQTALKTNTMATVIASPKFVV